MRLRLFGCLALCFVSAAAFLYHKYGSPGNGTNALGHPFLFQQIPPVDPSLANTSYELADVYYKSIGYGVCERLTQEQLSQKLWMSLTVSTPCDQFFEDFLRQQNLPPSDWPPPKTVPVELRSKYFLDGRITRESSYYLAQRYNGELVPYNWSTAFVNEYIKKAENKGNFHYGADTQQLYAVLQDFNLTGQSGMVIGSEVPWVEAILLTHGRVKNVLTVEYHPIISTHPQISYIHPVEFNQNWRKWADRKFDFAFTYSSLEHSGLGRYGDRLDPTADLKDLHKLSCLLPSGAKVFLGIPVGYDKIFWNAHRIYGKWRLPLISANYRVLAMYDKAKLSDSLGFISREGYHHALIVLENKGSSMCDN